MDFNSCLAQFRDEYERKARLLPGLLVVAPIVVAVVGQFGLKHPVLAAAASVLGTCGGMYGLASVVRGSGKELEDKLVAAWGGMPTTISLRHRDGFLDSVSKQRCHELITRKLGISMPSAEDERLNPSKADDTYIGATRRLRELTRGDKGLLLKENIAYGFHRNMLAMKPVGIVFCLIAILYGLIQAKAVRIPAPHLVLGALAAPGVYPGVTLAVALIFLVSWLLYFNAAAVRRIGFVYAERLFERLPSLKIPSVRRGNGTGAA